MRAQRRRASRLSSTSPTATRARKTTRSQTTSIATPAQRIARRPPASGGSLGKRRRRPPQRGAQTAQPILQGKVAGLHGQQQQAQQAAAGQLPRGAHRQRQLPLDGAQ